MKNPEKSSEDVDATRERTPAENEKLRRNQKVREKDTGPKSSLLEKNAAGLNEKEHADEKEDLYRDEENRGIVEAV